MTPIIMTIIHITTMINLTMTIFMTTMIVFMIILTLSAVASPSLEQTFSVEARLDHRWDYILCVLLRMMSL